MTITRKPGRLAGLLYLLGSIPAFFGLMYVPAKVMVRGDATATAHNILAFETLFRLGIVADLTGQALFVFVALALYHLLKGVDRRLALMMLTLILVSIPITFLSEVNAIAAIGLVHQDVVHQDVLGTGFLAVFDEVQRDALARFFLNLRSTGFELAGIFWGLWLFPMGLLVYRSGFIPRILGVLLMMGCFAYLANSLAFLVFPQYVAAVDRWASPVQLVEVVFMLWLLIMGAEPKPAAA